MRRRWAATGPSRYSSRRAQSDHSPDTAIRPTRVIDPNDTGRRLDIRIVKIEPVSERTRLTMVFWNRAAVALERHAIRIEMSSSEDEPGPNYIFPFWLNLATRRYAAAEEARGKETTTERPVSSFRSSGISRLCARATARRCRGTRDGALFGGPAPWMHDFF